eukprot:TRINITY_DN16514_c0_g1_i1.p1 TRINITY_DN16514_c0_g1~~TRINITY_DN16514_c0_g1_i1.p1  ORF type:complete len:289 (-),score=31.76 TRINITY_DN16514_c0_g1_i1:22-888(-)
MQHPVCASVRLCGVRQSQVARRLPPRLLLALDLDETLVRVCCEGVHHNRKLDSVDFRVPVEVGAPPKAATFSCGVAVRPGLQKFLDWVRKRQRDGVIEGPWIFTTSTPNYTKAVLRHIDPGGRIFAMRVLTRDACTTSRLPGFFLKDLSRIPTIDAQGGGGSDELRRRVLVDNNPVSCVVNPESSMLVRDWLGDNAVDNELQRVQETLDAILESNAQNFANADQVVSDYAGQLMALTPGHDRFSDRLKVLKEKLDAFPPAEVSELRSAMRAVGAECNSIKQELLGAAP